MNDFQLHPALAKDTCAITDLPLCRLLLSNDASYPWGILVPRRENISEIFQLCEADQIQLLAESSALGHCLQSVFQPDKLNIAALGNIVPQLHVHHIARYKNDKAWPGPIWGHSALVPYTASERANTINKISHWLGAQTNLKTAAAATEPGCGQSD